MGKLSIDTFLDKSRSLPMVDVRSPGEYAAGHMPGAHNIPLFDNEARAQVGTTYKQAGREEALLLGLDLIGPKMRSFVERTQQLAPAGEVLVHCWRGGMRSESFAWLLNTAGIKAHTLEGGYKAYRKHLLSAFRQPAGIVILGGETGSGKTAILQALAELGEQVIDLEGLANHRGSVFGGIGLGKQPSSEQFANNLYQHWQALDTSKRIWLEDESLNIGQVKLPYELWNQMIQASIVKVTLPKAERIQRLIDEYGKLDKEALKISIHKIQKRLGGLQTRQAIEALEHGRLAEVTDILLYYYDKSYQRCLARKSNKTVREIICTTDDPYANALKVREAITGGILTS